MTFQQNPPPHGVCLVGFMGAGKTSVGRGLAQKLGWQFLDLDEVIQKQEQRSIPDIFREDGEAAFRQAETAALHDVLSRCGTTPTVLAVGGGAFVQPENASALRAAGIPVVFLDAPLEELRRRCAQDGATRPLFQDENQFRQLYEARRQRYMEADLRVETSGLTLEEVACVVAQRLGWEEA